jgi:hypothetical protein
MNDGGAGDTLAPWNIPIYSAAARAEQVYERLFKYDPHASPKPRLAESVDSNAKATIWRLKIRSGVTFHRWQAVDGGRRPLLASVHRQPEEQGGVADAPRADRPQGLAQGVGARGRVPFESSDR